MKKVSVIIPCYNVENLIDRTLKSLEAQTVGIGELEIICVDDCSTDGTFGRLKAWEERYPEDIMLVQLPTNSRQGTARNVGLKYATCDYIAFIDSDDWVEKNYIERMLFFAEEYQVDVVQCELLRDPSLELSYIDDQNKYRKQEDILIRVNNDEDRKRAFHAKVINNNPPRKLIRRDLLVDNEIYFSEGLAYEDSFWGALLNLYMKSAYVSFEVLYHYYINDSSTVLSKNEIYHIDLLTNQIKLWNEFIRRGFMEKFRDEIEIEHVYSCALIFWKMIALRYDEPPYSLYRLLCAIVQEHVPDIMNNPYMKRGELDEFHSLVFKSCLTEMSREDFKKFAESVRGGYSTM